MKRMEDLDALMNRLEFSPDMTRAEYSGLITTVYAHIDILRQCNPETAAAYERRVSHCEAVLDMAVLREIGYR